MLEHASSHLSQKNSNDQFVKKSIVTERFENVNSCKPCNFCSFCFFIRCGAGTVKGQMRLSTLLQNSKYYFLLLGYPALNLCLFLNYINLLAFHELSRQKNKHVLSTTIFAFVNLIEATLGA